MAPHEQFPPFNETEREALRRLNVAALVLFGSRAQGVDTAASDYDIGVLVRDRRLLGDAGERRRLYDALYDFLADRIAARVTVDIVFLEDAPAELRAHVMRHGIPLYEGDPGAFARFKEQTMIAYADFAPHRARFHRAILERIR